MGALCLFYKRNLHIASGLFALLYAGAAWAQSFKGINEITIPFFGIPLTAVSMAATGTLIGFAHIDPIASRKKLYALMTGNTILSSWLVVLIPYWRDWTIPPGLLPPLAGVAATVTVVLSPIVVKRAPDIFGRFLDKWFGKGSQPTGGNG